MTNALKNIPLKTFQDYLKWKGCRHIRTNGGHEIWSRADLLRPIVLQTHKDPVPEFIVRRILKTLGTDQKDYVEFLRA